jgi:hypothetical protein
MYKRITVALLVAISLSLLVAGSGVFNGSSVWAAGPPETGDVIALPPGPVPEVVGNAKLVRNDNGVSVTIHTSELTAGDVVTVWAFVWKDPSLCSGPCDGEDIPLAVLPPPQVAGNIVGGNGTSNFGGHVDVWDSSENPDDSEIHFGLVTHGQKIPGIVDEQLSTPDAGCGGPCPLVQGVAFLAIP